MSELDLFGIPPRPEPDRYEIEVRINGERRFYVVFAGHPREHQVDTESAFVTHGSEVVLEEARFFAYLTEEGK